MSKKVEFVFTSDKGWVGENLSDEVIGPRDFNGIRRALIQVSRRNRLKAGTENTRQRRLEREKEEKKVLEITKTS